MGKPKDYWDDLAKQNYTLKEALRCYQKYKKEWEAAFKAYLDSFLPEEIEHRPDLRSRECFLYSPQAQELAHRWGLELALHPDDELWAAPREKDFPVFFKDPGQVVRVIPFNKTKHIPLSDEETLLDRSPHVREARYLCVEINLFGSEAQIMAEVKNLVQYYQGLIGKKKVRGPSWDMYLDEEPPGGPVTIFQVWKMKEEDKKTPWKIALELYPQLKGKSYAEKAKNYDVTGNAKRLREQIVTAIKRATKIINSITPTA